MVSAQMIHWLAYNCTTIVPGELSSICGRWQEEEKQILSLLELDSHK